MDLQALERWWQGSLDWPEGDHFFVLEGDARLAVVEFIDFFLTRCYAPTEGPLLLPIADGGSLTIPRSGIDPLPPATFAAPRPRWDAARRELRYGESLCRRYARLADSQFALLDAFESEGWPGMLSSDPFGLDSQLRQTILDLNKKMDENDSPIRFRTVAGRPGWCEREITETIPA